MTKTPVSCCILVIILSSYIGIIISHYKDSNEPTSIKGCHSLVLNLAQLTKLSEIPDFPLMFFFLERFAGIEPLAWAFCGFVALLQLLGARRMVMVMFCWPDSLLGLVVDAMFFFF